MTNGNKKYWCDHCGIVIPNGQGTSISNALIEGGTRHLCLDCFKSYRDLSEAMANKRRRFNAECDAEEVKFLNNYNWAEHLFRIRWADNLTLLNNGDLIDVNGEVVGHLNMEKLKEENNE